jgi:hypothetical protein
MRALSRRDNLTMARCFNAGDKFAIAQVPKGRPSIVRALVSWWLVPVRSSSFSLLFHQNCPS